MVNARRRKTKAGMGAVTATSGVHTKAEEIPLERRDTEMQFDPARPEATTGARRRFTQDIAKAFVDRHDTVPEMRITAPPQSGPVTKPPREPRAAIRVDEVPVSAKKITLRGPVELKPRVVNADRISRAPLDARDAFLLQLIDGTMSSTDLVDASGFTQADVDSILARLARLGIVAL
jgi:hypothetical protein